MPSRPHHVHKYNRFEILQGFLAAEIKYLREMIHTGKLVGAELQAVQVALEFKVRLLFLDRKSYFKSIGKPDPKLTTPGRRALEFKATNDPAKFKLLKRMIAKSPIPQAYLQDYERFKAQMNTQFNPQMNTTHVHTQEDELECWSRYKEKGTKIVSYIVEDDVIDAANILMRVNIPDDNVSSAASALLALSEP